MKYYSTRKKSEAVSLRSAVLQGLAADGGLFMPEEIPFFSEDLFFAASDDFEVLAKILHPFLSDELNEAEIATLLANSISFGAQLHQLDDELFVLELFHGPTCAFKDFGARFMARLMSHLCGDEETERTVLVATSGDTGGAVASGFHRVPGIKVIILYPSKQVSPLQEKQLTTLGDNITALEIQGTFDDCQALVKQAFGDQDLCQKLSITSANSINIARLLPQSLYYILAARALRHLSSKNIVFSVPSGNFGNLTGGLLAKKMGLPVKKFVAATNSNDVFTCYLQSGEFRPQPSKRTISNAMDVGNPSNFERINTLFNSSIKEIREAIFAASFNDDETKAAITNTIRTFDYTLDPHAAVALLGLDAMPNDESNENRVVLATAHPAKFLEVMEPLTPKQIEIPSRLAASLAKEKHSELLTSDFSLFKQRLLS